MFPTTPNETIRSLWTENTMNQVIDILVSQQEKNKLITLSALLIKHASEVMTMDGNKNVLKTDMSYGIRQNFFFLQKINC